MATMNGVPFRKMMVPTSKYSLKCPNAMKAKKITIHNTDNQMPAENEISYMRNNGSVVSYHFACDEKEIVQGLPTNRNGWHAGDGGNGYGNRNTIGWEMCRNYDRSRKTTNLHDPLKAQFQKTFQNTVKGVAQLCVDEGIVPSFDTIKQHMSWSGKHCPSKILNDKTWNKLVNEIVAEYNRLKGKPASKPAASKPGTTPPKKSTYTGGSIVDYLISIGENPSPARRRQLAKEYGVANYALTAAKNTELLNKMRGGKPASKPAAKPATKPAAKSISQMANEIIAGKHGSGHANRRKSLGISQSQYEKVRAEVNRRAGGGKASGKSISQMSTEIIQGKHGSGHDQRRKSLGISQAKYEKVRAEVNRRM